MGCASKLLTLLTSPLSKLHAFPSSLRLIRHPCISISSFPKPRLYSSSITRSLLPFSINPTSQLIHTPADNRFTSEDFHIDNSASSSSRVSHRWPEWSKLVDNLRASGYFDLQVGLDGEDALSVYLPEEFLQPVAVCLAFARRRADLLGSLSRKDIEAVVTNGSPFLFKSSLDSARRMKLFLDNTSVNELEFERAQTVDLMRFLLSHVYGPFVISEGPNLRNGQPVESSVRNLLTEMADASRAVQEFGYSSSKQFSDGYGQATRPLRQNIEMKRGDWICPRCSFMNFARNMKCLECSEARPKRQLSDGEWECPRCDFFNYSRNVVCKKCDCKRPGETSFGSVETRSTLGYNNESTRTAPLEQRLPDTQFQRNWGNDDALQGNNFRSVGRANPGTSTTGMPTSQSMDGMSGYASCPSEVKYNATATWQNTTGSEWGSVPSSSPHYTQQSDYVSVVPSPDGMFAKSQNSRQETTATWQNTTGSEWGSVPSSSSQQFRSFEGKQSDYVPFVPSPVNQTQNVAQQYENTQNARESWKGGFTGKSLEGSLVKEPDPLDMSEEAKAERWFRRASQIKDISELSQIPDEDFPQIMPMRKGVNRFVVSKRKTPLERRLTSPQYRRNLPIVSSEPLKKDENES